MTPAITNPAIIQQWVAEKLNLSAVEQNLLAMGFDELTQKAYLKEFKKVRNAKRQFAGFIYLGLGAFLGFISCILTVLNPFPDLYNWILFGLTTVAILLICYGMYSIFE